MITNESELAFWNDESLVSYFASKEPDPRIVAQIDALPAHSSTKALDLGCGGGRHTQLLAEADFITTAVDINPSMLTFTTLRTLHLGSRVNVGYGGIHSIPAPEDSYGIVVSTGVLHQAKSAEEMSSALDEIVRVSRKGAVFIGNLFVSDIWDSTYIIPDNRNPEYVETTEKVGMTLVDADRAVDMLKSRGFAFQQDPVLDFKQENTGPRGVLRFAVELAR